MKLNFFFLYKKNVIINNDRRVHMEISELINIYNNYLNKINDLWRLL